MHKLNLALRGLLLCSFFSATPAFAMNPVFRCLLSLTHQTSQYLKSSVDFYGIKSEHPKLDHALHMLGDPQELSLVIIESTSEKYIDKHMSHSTEASKAKLRKQIALGALKSKSEEIRFGTLELVKSEARKLNEIGNAEKAISMLIENKRDYWNVLSISDSLDAAIRRSFEITAESRVPYFRLIRRNVVRSRAN